MDFLTALHVSGSGLSAERTRVNLASSNLANAETTRGANGKPYQRLDPVFQSVHMGAQDEGPTVGQSPLGVQVSQIVADPSEGKKVYSFPHHVPSKPTRPRWKPSNRWPRAASTSRSNSP